MGLDTSHGCWHGSYGGFMALRNALAKATGYDEGADEDVDYVIPNIEGYDARNFQGWWDEEPENILDVFFVHSDCDGYIFPQHAEKLADALEKADRDLLEDWQQDALNRFVAGLRLAHENWEIVDFH